MPKKLIAGMVFVAVIAFTAYATSYFSRSPEYYCTTVPMFEVWFDDHTHKAAVLKKDCNMGESVFFSVRVDAFSPPLRHAWFTNREIEVDAEYGIPDEAPALLWSAPRKLEVSMKTRTLGGTLEEHVGDDLTVVRTFKPSTPNAFPVY